MAELPASVAVIVVGVVVGFVVGAVVVVDLEVSSSADCSSWKQLFAGWLGVEGVEALVEVV